MNWIVRIKWAIGIVVVLSIAGCSATSSTKILLQREAFSKLSESAEAAYFHGDIDNAISLWKSTSSRSGTSDIDYFEGRLYLDGLFAKYSIAWAMLEKGNRKGAKKYYNQLADEVVAIEAERKSFLLARQKTLAQRNIALQVFYGVTSKAILSPRQHQIWKNITEAEPMPLPVFDIVKRQPSAFRGSHLERTPFRVVAMPTLEPLIYIGKLSNGEGTCTASLVGWGIAITNAHCVTKPIDDRSGLGWARSKGRSTNSMFLTFDAPLFSPDIVKIVKYETHEGNSWNGGVGNDWAILFLDRHPVGRGHLGWLEDTSTSLPNGKNAKVMIAGFSADLNKGRYITMDYDCDAIRSNHLLNYFCESAPGSSGSPVLLVDGKFRHYYLVGIHNRAVKGKRIAGGVHVSAFASALRRAMEGRHAPR